MRLGCQKMISKRDGLAEIFLGGVVFLTALGFIAYVIQTTSLNKELAGKNFTLLAGFQSVDGIRLGSDVLLAGVRVGQVTQIELNKESFQAVVTLSLFEDYKLPDDTAAVINSDGLLGGKYISLDVGGSDLALNDGDELIYTQSSMSILNLLSKFAGQ